MCRFIRWKWLFTLVALATLLGLTKFVLHLLTPRNYPASESVITLELAGGPFVCRYYDAKPMVKGIVVLGTGDGGWSYWEDNTARSLSSHGYFVIGWDCRAFADSRTYDHEQLVDGFNAAVAAATIRIRQSSLPVWYGGWSTGAEQAVAAAASARRPTTLRGLLLAAPGTRGRFGMETSDLLGVMPTGPGTFALADLGSSIEGLRIAQFNAGYDPMDDTAWLEALRVPYKIYELPDCLHDMGGAGEEFQQKLLEAIDWTLSEEPIATQSIQLPNDLDVGCLKGQESLRWASDGFVSLLYSGADNFFQSARPSYLMKIHEYQGKQLFRDSGVPVLQGYVARTPQEAVDAFNKLGGPIAVVKAQIHAGGRGKGNIIGNPAQKGVVLVRSAAEAKKAAEGLLGNKLVTIQTGPEGQKVNQIFVEQGCRIARELYLGIVVDRAAAMPVLMCSSEGGVEIEKVAEETPDLILKEHFDPAVGLEGFQVRKLCKKLGIEGKAAKAADSFMKSVCKFFVKYDCSLAEINPLVITEDGEMIALDAKITFDDNAMFRHADLKPLRDLDEEEPTEVRAADSGLSYVKLEGNIACLVNGAGLAMSTMDIIKYHGGQPANFLDVGGGANTQQVTEAFRILLSDPNCKGVLVNIFGGIARCTTIATAIIDAGKEVGFNVPLVVRLEGTEVEEGRKMLENCDIKIISAKDLTDAAEKIVAAAK